MIIGTLLQLRNEGKVTGPAMVVTKASLKYQFYKEVQKFSELDAIVVQTLAQLKKDEDAFNAQFEGHDIYILNYESLRDPLIKKKMHKLKIQFMACDEIHYVKDDTTKRSKAVCEFSNVPYKIGSTATPVQKNPLDIFSLFKFLKPDLFPKKTTFGNQYVQWTTFGAYIRRPIGAKNEKELNSKIALYMITKTKEEISSQLPSLVVYQRTCSFGPKQQEQSNRLLETLNALHEQEKQVSVQLSKAGAKTSDALKAIEGKIMATQTFAQELANDEQLLLNNEQSAKYYTGEGSPKTDLCMDLVHEIIESGEKVCIFSRFKKYQEILTERINKEFPDIKIAYINGSLSADKRYEEAYTKFSDNDEYKVLLMTDAGAEGVSLGKCQYIIELDLANSYAVQTQRHGRIERADSTHSTVYVYQLLTENSYDDIAQRIIEKKTQYDAQIVHGETA